MPPVPMEDAVALCRDLLRPLFEYVGLADLLSGRMEVTDMEGGPLVRLELRAHMLQPAKVDPIGSHWFRGWHGTHVAAAASILAQGRVEAIPPPVGTGLVFLRAAPWPRPWDVRRLIGEVWQSSFGFQGLAFELECATTAEHAAIRSGGHDAEWHASQQGRVTSCGKRWTFPPDMSGVVALWVLVGRFRSVDVPQELRDARVFG